MTETDAVADVDGAVDSIDVLADVSDNGEVNADSSQVTNTDEPKANGVSNGVKRVGKSALDKLMDSLDDSTLTEADKKKVESAVATLTDAGVVTSGRGGGKSGRGYTDEMNQFKADYNALVKKYTGDDGYFTDLNGDKRKPQFYCPTVNAKNGVK